MIYDKGIIVKVTPNAPMEKYQFDMWYLKICLNKFHLISFVQMMFEQMSFEQISFEQIFFK
jgi:hypothetical protein